MGFYWIAAHGDIADVYLRAPDGLRVVPGVENHAGLEDDIRMRFSSWCASGEAVEMEEIQ